MKIPEHVKNSEGWKTLSHKRRCKFGAALSGLNTGMIFSFDRFEAGSYLGHSFHRNYTHLLLVDVSIVASDLMLLCRALETGDLVTHSWTFFKTEKITVISRP